MGSGKSTLLRMITRELLPTRGSVLVNNVNLRKMRTGDVPYYRRDVGLVAQDFKLIPHLTVYENVAFVMEAMAVPSKMVAYRANRVIEQVGLWRRRYMKPTQLSGGGQQQRVAIARALVGKAPLILADEPTGNLDTRTSEEIMALLVEVNREGKTVVLVTHEPDIAAYARRVLRFKDGCLVSDESVVSEGEGGA